MAKQGRDPVGKPVDQNGVQVCVGDRVAIWRFRSEKAVRPDRTVNHPGWMISYRRVIETAWRFRRGWRVRTDDFEWVPCDVTWNVDSMSVPTELVPVQSGDVPRDQRGVDLHIGDFCTAWIRNDRVIAPWPGIEKKDAFVCRGMITRFRTVDPTCIVAQLGSGRHGWLPCSLLWRGRVRQDLIYELSIDADGPLADKTETKIMAGDIAIPSGHRLSGGAVVQQQFPTFGAEPSLSAQKRTPPLNPLPPTDGAVPPGTPPPMSKAEWIASGRYEATWNALYGTLRGWRAR